MAALSPFTTEEGLRAYLTSHAIEVADITLLTGGTANYVYRVELSDGKTMIYKHAAPYLHSNSNFALDPTRMDYEDRVLGILPPLLIKELPSSAVHAVSRYGYDKEQKILCIEDGGSQNLKAAYDDPRLDILKIGQELGEWIAALHKCSTQTSVSLLDDKDLDANNPIAVAIYRHSYNNLATALVKYNHDADLAEFINAEFGSRLTTENECICHGDFWPGNVLVRFNNRDETTVHLTVVDWEMARRGTSATDVGQFAAEAFLLDRFRGERGLLAAFLRAYLEAKNKNDVKGKNEVVIGKEWVRRMAIHWAVHIAFWPTWVEWTDRQGTQKLVDIGVRVMKAAADGKWEELLASELFENVTDLGWNLLERE